jgi:hypothetical protein
MKAAYTDADYDAKEDGCATKYGDGAFLQLASIGIIDDVLGKGNFHQIGMYCKSGN